MLSDRLEFRLFALPHQYKCEGSHRSPITAVAAVQAAIARGQPLFLLYWGLATVLKNVRNTGLWCMADPAVLGKRHFATEQEGERGEGH